MSVTWHYDAKMKIKLYKYTNTTCLAHNNVYYQAGCVVCLYSQFRSRDISQCFFNFSPHVWSVSKTFLDSGFHAVDSGFQVQNYRSFSVELGFWIPHQKFPWFRNPDSLTWGEISIVFTSKDMQNIWKDKEKLNILQRKYRAVLNGLFRVNKSSEVHGDRQKEAE